MRPNRSDAHLSPEEEAKREEEAREYFDEIAPKRHTKPSRSEYSAVYADALSSSGQDPMPELEKLLDLEAKPEKLVCEGCEVGEEFVETEYYEDLNSIDKQHHTTGTGFIQTDKPIDDDKFGLNYPVSNASDCHPSCKGNPATNEWIPSADPVIGVSNKPSRSDDA